MMVGSICSTLLVYILMLYSSCSWRPRSTVVCSNQNELIQKCSGLVSSMPFLLCFLLARSMRMERGKWLNHFGKISRGSNESIPGAPFKTMVITALLLRPALTFKLLDDHLEGGKNNVEQKEKSERRPQR